MLDTLAVNTAPNHTILDEKACYAEEATIFDKKASYEDAPPRWDLSVLPPEVLVDIAMERLSAAGVQLIEWRALLYRRLNVPIIAKVRKYLLC